MILERNHCFIGSGSGLHAIGGPFQGAGANKSALYECYTKIESNRSMYNKIQ